MKIEVNKNKKYTIGEIQEAGAKAIKKDVDKTREALKGQDDTEMYLFHEMMVGTAVIAELSVILENGE